MNRKGKTLFDEEYLLVPYENTKYCLIRIGFRSIGNRIGMTFPTERPSGTSANA